VAPTLVCCAAPIGYGPATKLAAIAGALRAHGLRPVFLGSGSALELARRSPAFDDVVAAEPDAPAARAAIDAGVGLLSLMERGHLGVAQARGRRTFVVDSLLWMRDHVPPAFGTATRYWAQDFVGVRGRATGLATVVGPLVPPPARATRTRRLVIALGGAPSPLGDAGDDDAWLDLLADGVVASGLVDAFPDGVVCMASEACRARLAARHPGRGIEFVSLSPEGAATLLASAALVLAAPGLTTTLECFQLGVPTHFLPPLGYSQWLNYGPRDAVRAGMPEPGRPARVHALIRTPLYDPATRAAFVARLAAVRDADHAALAMRQHAFFQSLGPRSVDAIAGEIATLCADGGRS
jgi:hypothetical protein